VPGIANNSLDQFVERVRRFDRKYIKDWDLWLATPFEARPHTLGAILRKWQACRPNPMRRTRFESKHEPPFLEHLVEQATPHLRLLEGFDIGIKSSFTDASCDSLIYLWNLFSQLSYKGEVKNNRVSVRDGRAGVVGISKAVLLLSDGRIGPAFDSEVRNHLGIKSIENSNQWIHSLIYVSNDITEYQRANQRTLAESVPQFSHLNSGRIYDMALGPGAKVSED
jgi:hypothetical protein